MFPDLGAGLLGGEIDVEQVGIGPGGEEWSTSLPPRTVITSIPTRGNTLPGAPAAAVTVVTRTGGDGIHDHPQ
jgi:hypothetical protein